MRMYKRSEKSPRTKAHPPRTFQQKQPMKRVLSRSYQEADFGENNSVKSIGSSYSNSRFEPMSSDFVSREALDDIGQQLSETIDENSMMKSRLHMELKERHILEMKIKDLTEKLLDARKGLQETGAALYKVQQATDALMKKRDQREIQLQKSQEVNAAQEARIVELEGKLSKAIDGTKVQATIGSFRKIIGEKDDIIRILEEQQYNTQTQLTKVKREAQRFADERQELEQVINTKQKKISGLEAAFRQLESKLNSGELTTANGSGSPLKEIQTSLLDALNSPLREYNSMNSSGTLELKQLESRMAQLETQLKHASLNGGANGSSSSTTSLSSGKSPSKTSKGTTGAGVIQQSAATTKAFDEAEQLLAEIELKQRLEEQRAAEELALEQERRRKREEEEQRRLMKQQQEQHAKMEAEAKEAVRLQFEQQQFAQQEQLRKQMEFQKQQDLLKQQEFLKQAELLKQQQEEQQRQFQQQQLMQQQALQQQQVMEQEKQRQASILMQQHQQQAFQQQTLQQQQLQQQMEQQKQMEQLKQQQLLKQQQEEQQKFQMQQEMMRQQQLFMQQQQAQAQQAEMLRQQQLQQQQQMQMQQQQAMQQQQQAEVSAKEAAKAQKLAEQQAFEEKQRQMIAQQKKEQEQLLLEQQQLRAIEDQRSPPKQRGKSMRASGGSMVAQPLGAPIVPQAPVAPSMAPAVTPLAPVQVPANVQNTPTNGVPAASSGEDGGAAAQLKAEIAEMTASNKSTKGLINKFTEEFSAKEGRKPNKDDRRVHAKDIFSSYHKTAREIKKKQKQLLKLQGGSSKSLKFSKNDDDDDDDSGDD